MAIRSNSKAATDKIKAYIWECLVERSDESSRFNVLGATFEGLCKAYTEYLDEIFRNDYKLKSTADRVRYDLDGGGAWEVGTWERAKMVGFWLDETEDEIDRYYERGKADDMWRNLIVREVMKAAGR